VFRGGQGASGGGGGRGPPPRPQPRPPPPAGLLDSNWSVGGVLEKKLPPLPVTLALGAFLNHWKNRFHCGFSTQQAKFLTWQFDGEYRGDDCTATLTLGNPDLLGESVILVAHFLQSVTPRLVLGGEMVYHRRPGEEGAILTLAGKYTGTRPRGELEANTRLQDTTFAFGYQLNLPQANVVFRGLLDSNWSVGGVLEKKLPPLPVTLALGAFLNHWKNRFHCGFSVIVG
uniref:Translocase of outer mitochondrial membrane 40 like n=1 Tax=Anas platyrhynchos platyrhynchos TaxID=8840 RepID=A0A493SWN9_ANAPP